MIRDHLGELRKELKQAKVDFQTEKAHHLDDVTEFRYKDKDREALVKPLVKYKVLGGMEELDRCHPRMRTGHFTPFLPPCPCPFIFWRTHHVTE